MSAERPAKKPAGAGAEAVELPERASAVVVGGGVIGASVAYHLAKLGWSDVLLLERGRFAGGTSWHAAGLIGTVRPDESLAQLADYSRRLLFELEEETGQATGFRQVGSLAVAHAADRFEELKRLASMNNGFGSTRVEMVTAEEIGSLYPPIETAGLLGGTWVPTDGMASPVDVVAAFIRGARDRGARCLEGVRVTAVHRDGERVAGVGTDAGDVRAEFVVNCAGLWGREVGRMAGVGVPLYACEHYYAHTEKLPELPPDLPTLRDYDIGAYIREDAGSLLVGAFEPHALPIAVADLPADFCFDELPGHAEEQLMPILEAAGRRLPILERAGWRSFFCGPESFTPDDRFHLGEAAGVRNFFVACGLNSVGIQSAGGIGKALAEWMDRGHAPLDLAGNDPRRMAPVQGTRAYLRARVRETLGLLYARHYPFRQYETARGVRHSPLHERLAARGACFGETAGWERPNWYAPPGVEPVYEYGFGRQNWFEYSAAEHRAAREGVALFDQSSFAKFLVEGRDAVRELQRICTADVDVAPGRIVYTHWLNERGGIEADLTVTRLAEHRFWVVTGPASAVRDRDWLERHLSGGAHCVVADLTAAWAVLGVMGPGSGAVLEAVTGEDLSAERFPFGASREMEAGCALVRATRVSFVGERGWELYVPADQARHVFDAVVEAGGGVAAAGADGAAADGASGSGPDGGVRLAGFHALDSCRIEKKFLHFGHDVAGEDTPLEAGVGFVCDFDKAGGFIGRDALARQRERPLRKRLVQFLLQDPDAILYHHEPILRDGEVVGYLTSGAYGHTLGGAVGLGYVRAPEAVSAAWLDAGRFEIEVAGERIPAKASLRAMYDPTGARARG